MLFRAALLLSLSALALSVAREGTAEAQTSVRRLDPSAWTIGPVVRGRNYSRGMPAQPSPSRSGGFEFALPQAPGSVHAVTFPHGSLAGKRRIVMRYRVEAAPGVQIVPRTAPNLPSMITLYFQRGGDDWSGVGPFEAYRWYATFATQSPIRAGEHVLVAPLNGNWTAVQRSNARTNPAAFRAALAGAEQVGFVLGGGDGFGHGVRATGPARLIVTDFRIE
jgi:hypothetical protein